MNDCAACERLPAQDGSLLCHVCRAEYLTAVAMRAVREGTLSPYCPGLVNNRMTEKEMMSEKRNGDEPKS